MRNQVVILVVLVVVNARQIPIKGHDDLGDKGGSYLEKDNVDSSCLDPSGKPSLIETECLMKHVQKVLEAANLKPDKPINQLSDLMLNFETLDNLSLPKLEGLLAEYEGMLAQVQSEKASQEPGTTQKTGTKISDLLLDLLMLPRYIPFSMWLSINKTEIPANVPLAHYLLTVSVVIGLENIQPVLAEFLPLVGLDPAKWVNVTLRLLSYQSPPILEVVEDGYRHYEPIWSAERQKAILKGADLPSENSSEKRKTSDSESKESDLKAKLDRLCKALKNSDLIQMTKYLIDTVTSLDL